MNQFLANLYNYSATSSTSLPTTIATQNSDMLMSAANTVGQQPTFYIVTWECLAVDFPCWACIYLDILTLASALMYINHGSIWLVNKKIGHEVFSQNNILVHPLYKIVKTGLDIKVSSVTSELENPHFSKHPLHYLLSMKLNITGDDLSLLGIIICWITKDLIMDRDSIIDKTTACTYNFGFHNLNNNTLDIPEYEIQAAAQQLKKALTSTLPKPREGIFTGLGPKLPSLPPPLSSLSNMGVFSHTDTNNRFLYIWQVSGQLVCSNLTCLSIQCVLKLNYRTIHMAKTLHLT